MKEKDIFPVSVQLWVRFLSDNGTLLHKLPFRYTVKHAKHWGLLKKAYQSNGVRHVSSPTNKHFTKFASAMTNTLLDYLGEHGTVSVQVVGPNLVHEHRQEDVYANKVFHLFALASVKQRYKLPFYAIRGLMKNTIRKALVTFMSVYLDKMGYRPQKRPRKYLRDKRKEWRGYKGLMEALITPKEAFVNIDYGYKGSLLDVKILPEILRYAQNSYVFWAVNTPEQAIEAELLHTNGCVTIREKFDDLEF